MFRPPGVLVKSYRTIAVFLFAGVSAFAGSVTFNFNSLTAGANDASVQSYMQGVLNATYGVGAVTVAVTGAIGDKGANQTGGGLSWNGDGHVVGGNSGSPGSITLGNSDNCSGNACTAGSSDGYIRNNSLGLSGDPASDAISVTFTGQAFTQASFDYEIFPDGTCPSLGNCGGAGNPNLPDLEFKAGSTTVATLTGVVPGTGGTYSRSPLGAESAPQAIGTGSWTFASSTSFQFVDWPSTIGIDNLTLTGVDIVHGGTGAVPEPASVALLLTTLAGCYLVGKKRRKV
jgi:hypothetical protein